MIPRPNNRAMQTGDNLTRKPAVVGASAPVGRKPANVRDVLGRDPQEPDVFCGGTGLIKRQTK